MSLNGENNMSVIFVNGDDSRGWDCYQMVVHVCNEGDGTVDPGRNLKVNLRRGLLGYATLDRRSNYMPVLIIYLKESWEGT